MVESEHLRPISRIAITDIIMERLMRFIVDSNMRPGDKLPSERDLMQSLGVGRSSLREALKGLEAVGIVEIAAGEGIRVGRGDSSLLAKPLSWSALINESNLREVMEARRMFEVEMAGLAAERGSESDVRAITEEMEKLKAVAEVHSAPDVEFHLAVARASGNRLLVHVFETLYAMLRALRDRIPRDSDGISHRRRSELPDLIAIHEAILARDSQRARKAMDAHLRATEESLFPPQN